MDLACLDLACLEDLEKHLVLHLDASSQESLKMDANLVLQWHDTRATHRAARFVTGVARLEHDAQGTPLVAPEGECLKCGVQDLNKLLNFGCNHSEKAGFTVMIVYQAKPDYDYGQTLLGFGHGGSGGTDWRLWVSGRNAQNQWDVPPHEICFGTGPAVAGC